MDAFFRQLGRAVRARWQAENFSLDAFPALAAEALHDAQPGAHVELAELVRAFLLDDEQPPQSSSGFGQPEIIVHDDARFYIQLLFWLDGTTQIHQHEFSGAFHVLSGSSLHTEFAFEKVRPVSAHFRLGDLRPVRTELLETGRTVPIVSGNRCIHSLFHLDSPSVTLVVRTHTDPGTGPQFTYLPPHVAVDPFFTDALTTRRLQLLDVLERTGDPAYGERVREMLAVLDYERGFFVLQNGLTALRDLGEWPRTWAVFAEKHGELAAFAEPTLDEIIWRDRLTAMRTSFTDPDHRFFLALLLNVPARAGILTAVAERTGGDAASIIMGWAEELAESSDEGTWILDAEYPGLGDESALGDFLEAFRALLEGESIDEDLRTAFANSSLRALTR